MTWLNPLWNEAMKRRLVIFVIFDCNGIIWDSDIYLLKELCTVSKRQIVCLNGDGYSDTSEIMKHTKEIVHRDNCGFDGGAVKDVLTQYLQEDELASFDELIVCNNSFFGPFEPFQNIFKSMDVTNCDYWGLTGDDEAYASFISGVGSYFWVFRERIINDVAFLNYFKDYIDSKTTDFNEVIGRYECGVNNFLLKKYRFAVYRDMYHLNIFEAADLAAMKYDFPIIKRKFFVERRTDSERIKNVLRYVREKGYNPSYIEKKIAKNYGINLTDDKKPWTLPIINEDDYRSIAVHTSEDEVVDFLDKHGRVYVYGTGVFGSIIWGVFAHRFPSIVGYVKTEKGNELEFHGIPVYNISEIDKDAAIIIALNKSHEEEVKDYLIGRQVLYVF